MTELTQADYQRVAGKIIAPALVVHNGVDCFGAISVDCDDIRILCEALTLAARVPQTMDAPLRNEAFDCGELDLEQLDIAIRHNEQKKYSAGDNAFLHPILQAAKLYRTQATITDEMVERAAAAVKKELSASHNGTFNEKMKIIARAALEAAWGLK
jgi:hypothetical protein